MAWVEKMPSGRYRGGYRVTVDGQRVKRYVTDEGRGYERKTDAREAAQEAEVRSRRRAAVAKGTQSADIAWGDWWDLLSEKRGRPDTDTAAVEHSIVENHLRPKWGHVPINKITYRTIKEWVWDGELKVRPGMSIGYVHRIVSLFSATLTAATEGEHPLLEVSPCAGLKLPRRPRKAKPYLSVSTMDAMAPELREDYRDALEFDMETALRPGEICGLHADRLDLERGWMLVAEVFVTRRRIIRPFPKDEDARMVPLTPKAVEIARRRLEGRDLTKGCGVPHSDGSVCSGPLLFLTTRGRVMSPDGIRARMKVAARRAGVERRTPYAGRRGAATRMAEGGLDAFQIAEILGHSTLDQAQEYVQQTPLARMKLTAALSKYPGLVLLDGGMGHGADRGADPARRPPEPTGIEGAESTG